MCEFCQKEEGERRVNRRVPWVSQAVIVSPFNSIFYVLAKIMQTPARCPNLKVLTELQDKDHHCILDSEEVENATDGSYEIQMEGLK